MARFQGLRVGIQGRLILALVGTAGLAAVLVSSIAYVSARDALTNAQFEKLTTIREHKASQIEHYLLHHPGAGREHV